MKYRYSTLDAAQRCPRKYQLRYIDNVKTETESGDMRFGTAMHAALQAVLEGDDGHGVFRMFWDSLSGENLKWGMWNHEAYASMGPTFIERFQRLHVKKYKPLAMEETLTMEHEGVEFEGTPDFVGEFEGVMSLLDFKTSRSAYDVAKLVCNPQMYLYAAMAEKKYGIKINQLVYVVLVKHPGPRIQTLTLPLSDVLFQDHLKNLVAQAKELDQREIFPKATGSCLMGSFKCEYFAQCWGKENA